VDNQTDVNAQFKAITDANVGNDANTLLERQLERARLWRQERLANGESDSLADFIRQLISEPNEAHRKRTLAAYGAAMYRLMAADDGS
jgi:hypothetical protein